MQIIPILINIILLQVPVDSLNKLMGNQEELVKVLERHIVPGVRMEGKEVPSGNKKFKSAAGEEIITDRSKFVKVKIFFVGFYKKFSNACFTGDHPCQVCVCC